MKLLLSKMGVNVLTPTVERRTLAANARSPVIKTVVAFFKTNGKNAIKKYQRSATAIFAKPSN